MPSKEIIDVQRFVEIALDLLARDPVHAEQIDSRDDERAMASPRKKFMWTNRRSKIPSSPNCVRLAGT